MPTFEITKTPFKKKTFVGSRNGKEMAVWEIELKDEDDMYQTVELVQLESTPAPAVGPIEGTIDASGPYAAKFTKARPAYNGSGGSGGGYGKSDQERAEIRRSVAVKAAVELLACEVAAGMTFDGKPYEEILGKRIAFFDEALKP